VLAVLITSPWWAGRALFDTGWRRMVLGRLTIGLPARPTDGRERILIHGVSVGEIKAAQSIVHGLREICPQREVVLSTSTNTGVEVAQQLFPELQVVRFPIDFSPLVRRFLRRVRPACALMVELEVWPNFLRLANQRGVPVAILNGRITDKSFDSYDVFKRYLPQFNRISLVCAQSERYADRFAALALPPERLVVTGNVKVDGLRTGRVEPSAELRTLVGAGGEQLVVVAGSTHEPEELSVLRAVRAGLPGARLILVPRHPRRAHDIQRELEVAGAPPQLWTQLRGGAEAPDPARPLLVDTIGELEKMYGLADLVFVGGSLIPHGGQNMLEPAAQGRPVLHGPHVANFSQESALLVDAGASLCVADEHELGRALAELGADAGRRATMSRAGIEAVDGERGAAALTLAALEQRCLGCTSPSPTPA